MTGELRFDGRVAIVTGAGRGVGRSHALLLAARGAHVVVADYGVRLDGSGSSSEPAAAVVAEIRAAGGRAVACFASVADEEGARSVVDTAVDAFGRVDIVVNNAGISDPDGFEALTVSQFRAMVDVHYFGSLLVTRAAWPHFRRAGYGRVVNTVSEAMLGNIPEMTSYGPAKGAVWGLTRSLATEAAGSGIRVNAVAPRAFTRMSDAQSAKIAGSRGLTPEMMDQINAAMPPDMVAPAAAFLAHENCELNGEVLRAGLGGVARIAIVASQGIYKTPLTAEDIAENLTEIMDIRDSAAVEIV
ncbi:MULTISPECIES: SDR family NAD(P)-dependent oxidoreductase [Nocardia]|uniref:SDR family NAD(P)-dependent oxidoreductase n=1 Tax=Nocardia TaxID=1817 RepID=UPI000D685CB8|nr:MULTISPECIES: SDR family NAD(P)-dependent oxidoreductase [Nocardia]